MAAEDFVRVLARGSNKISQFGMIIKEEALSQIVRFLSNMNRPLSISSSEPDFVFKIS